MLEVGTGSGYQSAYRRYRPIRLHGEIVKPLAERTRSIFDFDQRWLQRIRGDQEQGRRRLLWMGRGGAVRQDHRHLRHRPRSSAAAAAVGAGRDHGDSGRAASSQRVLKVVKTTAGRRDDSRPIRHYGGRSFHSFRSPSLKVDQIVGDAQQLAPVLAECVSADGGARGSTVARLRILDRPLRDAMNDASNVSIADVVDAQAEPELEPVRCVFALCRRGPRRRLR